MADTLVTILNRELRRFFLSAVGKKTVVWFLAIVVMLGLLFSYQASTIAVGAVGQQHQRNSGNELALEEASVQISDTLTEGTTSTKSDTIGDGSVVAVTFTLTWMDEPNTARHANQPDSFALEIVTPDGTTKTGQGTNPQGEAGNVTIEISRDTSADDFDVALWDDGTWGINVTLSDAGDQTPTIGPAIFGFRTQTDAGNAYTLDILYTYVKDA